MYENFRYLHDFYGLYTISLQEYLDKGRKNHVFYGKKYSVKIDGFYNEYMEFGKQNRSYGLRNSDRYIEYKLEKELDDRNAFLRCYINLENRDEYLVLICCKIGSKRSEKCKRLFTLLKEDKRDN